MNDNDENQKGDDEKEIMVNGKGSSPKKMTFLVVFYY